MGTALAQHQLFGVRSPALPLPCALLAQTHFFWLQKTLNRYCCFCTFLRSAATLCFLM